MASIPRTRPKSRRDEGPSVGDTVWVRTGLGPHEEPAKVLEIGCEYEEEASSPAGIGEGDSHTGVLVRFNVSLHQAIFPKTAIRAFSDDNPSSRRRSPRQITPATAEPQTTQSQPYSRQVVTPSPIQTTLSQETETNKSMPPKRKRLQLATQSVPEEKEQRIQKARKNEDSKKLIEFKHVNGDIPSEQSDTDEGVIDKVEPTQRIHEVTKTTVTPSIRTPVSTDAINEHDMEVGSDELSDENGVRQFRIEYSTTGRATCKRCDVIIKKGVVRIAHEPLFRGKPGFTVYRHLECTVFSEEVVTAKDVGGWKKLSPEDYARLVDRVGQSKIELDKEMEELEPDELVPVAYQGELRSPPPGLVANLLPFQVEGSSWMYCQEVHEPAIRGGILADEMGMGKTLQALFTILDNRPRLQHSKPGSKHPPSLPDFQARIAEEKLWDSSLADWRHEMEMNNVPKSLLPIARGGQSGAGARAGTLVICPLIALTQWKTEIEKFSENGTLTVGTYHGPKRASETPRELLRKFDVVLTTYQVLEADYRKMTSPNKVKCPNCGGKFKVDKLRIHLKYFCGDGAQRTEAQARQRRNRDQNVDNRRDAPTNDARGKKDSKKKSLSEKVSVDYHSKQLKLAKDASLVKTKEKGGSSAVKNVVAAAVSHGRPARSAAKIASNRLSSSKAEWGHTIVDSSDSYEDVGMSSDDSTSDEDDAVIPKERKSKVKSTRKSNISFSSDSEGTSDDCEENNTLKRALEKQRAALTHAQRKNGKGSGGKSKKSFDIDKKGKKETAKGSDSRKKKEFKKSDPSSSDGGSSGESERDQMDDLNMDKLVNEAMQGSQMSVLHSLCWWRIVLDEAHMIKSRSSQTANAAFALIGVHRWCLSGTPLQNRVGEFYSLIRFLRMDPMAHYFCRAKGCDCKSLNYRMLNGKCQGCGHGSVQHFSHFNKHVLNPIQRTGYSGDGRRAMFTLKNDVLDKCLLRRTKENRAEDMNLPPRLVTIRTVRMHPVEEDFYNALYTQTRNTFNDYVSNGTLLNNYAHIFDLLMRMRQAVDHPYLVVYSKRDTERRNLATAPPVANGSIDCDICHEPPTERVLSSCCQAAFCRACVIDYMSSLLNELDDTSTQCPSCRAPFTIDLNQVSSSVVDDGTLGITPSKDASNSDVVLMPSLKEFPNVASGSILRRINLAEFATSTKIEALTVELVRMRQTSPGSKAIVFSQFVNMLDLIRWRLHSDPCLAMMGLGARALHGSMDIKARDASLKEFRENSNVRVLLMSLKAGGVALNLTVANHIYLMDPWWNPAAEMQAIDRTHRLGQYRPIRAVRFIAENTVEERILQLQEKKRLVFDGTVGRDAGSLKMLTVDDMKSLFA